MRSIPLSVVAPDAAPGAVLVTAALLCLIAGLAVAVLLQPGGRRRHGHRPGVSAGEAEKQAWPGGTDACAPGAVDVVPGKRREPAQVTGPPPAGADLDEVIEADHPVAQPGRHRRPSRFSSLWPRRPLESPRVDVLTGLALTPPDGTDDGTDGSEIGEPEPAAEDGGAPLEPLVLHPGVVALVDELTLDDDEELLEEEQTVGTPSPWFDQVAHDEDDTTPTDPAQPAASDEPGLLPPQRTSASPSPSQRRMLRAAGRRLAVAEDRATVASVVTHEAASVLKADICALVVPSVEGPRVLAVHPSGTDGQLWGRATLEALLGFGAPFRELLPGDPLAGGATTALLAVPVFSGGAVGGSLIARRRSPHAFSAAEEDAALRLARMAGAAMHAVARRNALDRAARTDASTGLPDEHRLRADLQAALRAARTHRVTASLVLAELAGLERARVELGDGPAEEAFTVAARALADALRVGDVLYRLDGDVFAVLLPGTSSDVARVLSTRLRSAVAEALAAAHLPAGLDRLLLRTVGVLVEGTAAQVVADATQALVTRRVEERWERPAVSGRS